MSIKNAIACWLAPEVFERSERYYYLRDTLSDAQMWLAYEWPEVDTVIFWAKVSEVNHFRKLGVPSVAAVPGKPWIHTISDFRDHLRKARDGNGASAAANPNVSPLEGKAP